MFESSLLFSAKIIIQLKYMQSAFSAAFKSYIRSKLANDRWHQKRGRFIRKAADMQNKNAAY
jgi:hypothetical protein